MEGGGFSGSRHVHYTRYRYIPTLHVASHKHQGEASVHIPTATRIEIEAGHCHAHLHTGGTAWSKFHVLIRRAKSYQDICSAVSYMYVPYLHVHVVANIAQIAKGRISSYLLGGMFSQVCLDLSVVSS